MSDYVSPLLQWLHANPELAGIATFIISAAESIAIIGTILPGSIMMTALGTLAGAGIIPLQETIIWAILGAIAGDGISYWIGYHFKDRLHRLWPFRNHPSLLKAGEKFVHRYGGMSVFIGRFVGPVRALVPVVAGMLGMRPYRFIAANVTSAIGWAILYLLPGILLGAASLELPPDIAIHVMVVVLLSSLFILLCLWFLYKLYQLIRDQINQLQDWIWFKLKKYRICAPIVSLIQYHDENRHHGQLGLTFLFIITTTLLLLLALHVKDVGSAQIYVNDIAFHLFRGLSLRSDDLDNFMINITLLGQKQVILPAVIVLFAWLISSKRWRAAFHTIAVGFLASGGVYIIKNWVQSSRPWGIAEPILSYSMPSGHTTLAASVYMGLAFLIARGVSPGKRWLIYTPAIIVTLLVAFSRLYLGAHWLTDTIAALLLSASVLTIVIISFQRKIEAPINPISCALITLITLAITFSVYHYYNFQNLTQSYTQSNLPTSEISMGSWWHKNMIPSYRTSLFGFPSQRINIEWAGNIEEIKALLIQEGWSKPPARDWVSTLHRIADVRSARYLPMISPQYLDKKPEIILTRLNQKGKALLVIRLWDTNIFVKDKDSTNTLWIGIVAEVASSYSWIFKKSMSGLDISASLLFPENNNLNQWEWKFTTVNDDDSYPKQQKIIMIRKK